MFLTIITFKAWRTNKSGESRNFKFGLKFWRGTSVTENNSDPRLLNCMLSAHYMNRISLCARVSARVEISTNNTEMS